MNNELIKQNKAIAETNYSLFILHFSLTSNFSRELNGKYSGELQAVSRKWKKAFVFRSRLATHGSQLFMYKYK